MPTQPSPASPPRAPNAQLFGQRERLVPLRPGLELLLGDFRLDRPCTFQFETSGDTCDLAFVLSGVIRHQQPPTEAPLPSPHAAFWLPPKRRGCHACSPQDAIRFVTVRIHRTVLSSMLGSDVLGLPPQAQLLLAQAGPACFHHVSILTAPMEAAAWHLLQCPSHGATQRLFMEGKALELTARLMARLSSLEPLHAGDGPGHDETPIHRASQILRERMADPPSLSSLAREVGMSESALTRGFRRVFGESVFGHLRAARLETARALLEEGALRATDVAYAVGFSSPAHLARQFRQRYGRAPGQYRREALGA